MTDAAGKITGLLPGVAQPDEGTRFGIKTDVLQASAVQIKRLFFVGRWAALAALGGAMGYPVSLEAKFMLIAHRGAAANEPENTLASFNRAKKVADFVEYDVWATKDGQLAVIHDSTVDRTTNGKGSVSGMTLAELRQLDDLGRVRPRGGWKRAHRTAHPTSARSPSGHGRTPAWCRRRR